MKKIFIVLPALFLMACSTTNLGRRPAQASQQGLVDFHVHIQSPEMAQIDGSVPPTPYRGAEEVLADMDKHGIDKSVLLSGAYLISKESTFIINGQPDNMPIHQMAKYIQNENNFTLNQAEIAPGRLVPFCGIPLDFSGYKDEIKRCYKLGARGIKLHFQQNRVFLSKSQAAKTFQSILKLAEQQNMIVLAHLSDMTTQAKWDQFVKIASTVKIPIVVAHVIFGYSTDTVAEFVFASKLKVPKNLYFDLSVAALRSPSAVVYSKFYQNGLLSRLIFGVDSPGVPYDQSIESFNNILDSLKKLGATESNLNNMRRQTALSLLNIPEK